MIARIVGIDGEMDGADDLLVARETEIAPSRDIDTRHLRADGWRHNHQRERRQKKMSRCYFAWKLLTNCS